MSSTGMSSMADATSASTAASSTPTCAGLTGAFVVPVEEPACAIPSGDEAEDHMRACCNDADIVSYYDGCGLYCLSIDQSIDDLQQCLQDDGANPGEIYCSGTGDDTATNTDAKPAESAQASVVVSGGDDNSDSDDNDSDSSDNDGDSDNDSDSDSDSSSSSDSDDSDSSGSAAPALTPEFGISKAGVMIGVLLLGAFQAPFWML